MRGLLERRRAASPRALQSVLTKNVDEAALKYATITSRLNRFQNMPVALVLKASRDVVKR